MAGRRRLYRRRHRHVSGRLPGGPEVSAGRDDARRSAGRGQVQHRIHDVRDPGARGQGLREPAAELPREHGLWRRVPARHGRPLFSERAPRRHDRRRRDDSPRDRRPRPHGEDGVERRRAHDEQDHHVYRPVQGRSVRRRRGAVDLDVRAERHPLLPNALVRRHTVAEERANRRVLEQLAAQRRRQREDADAVLRRRT